MTSSESSGNRVRRARLAAGLTQAQLAVQADISRTAVTAIEGNRLVPSVQVALAVARVLNLDVERLFGQQQPQEVLEWAWSPPSLPWRAYIAESRGRFHKIPVEDVHAAAWPHDVFADDGVLNSHTADLARRTLVVATCDPAAGLWASMCWRQTGIRVVPVVRSSRVALDLLAAGKVHAAGIHIGGEAENRANTNLAASRLTAPFALVRTADWTEGIAVGSDVRGNSVTQLRKKNVRWIGREIGSGARQCLDELLGPRRSYDSMAGDHRGVAELIAAGAGDAGICVELAAAERGQRFIALQQEHHDLCVPVELLDDPRLRALIRVLRSPEYRAVIADLPGYSTSEAGAVTSHSPCDRRISRR
jgi:putative molybdopterin biosynthesis protein